MKWHWGKGIAVTYIVFVIVVVIHVIVFINLKVELVTDNYYEKELNYQEQINKINNAKSLKQGIKLEQYEKSIKLIFPKIISNGTIKGEIYFYKPSDSGKDFIIPIQTDENYSQLIKTDTLTKGLWKIKIDWEAGGIQYYNEEILIMS
jgi:hypothetical protein